jgi:hypothetical protein
MHDMDRKKEPASRFYLVMELGQETVDDHSNFMGDYSYSDMKEGYIIDGVYTDKPDLDLFRKEDAEFVNQRHTLLNYTRE